MQLLKSAQGKKASELIDKAIKDRDAGRIRYITEHLYMSQNDGVCGMCVDGAIMRYSIGKKEFIKYTESTNNYPDIRIMQHFGLDEEISSYQYNTLKGLDDYHFTMPIWKVMFMANDNGASWEEIRDWLKSIGK